MSVTFGFDGLPADATTPLAAPYSTFLIGPSSFPTLERFAREVAPELARRA